MEAETVGREAVAYFQAALRRCQALTSHFQTSTPDFALALQALPIVRSHHGRTAEWYINLPSGCHLVNLSFGRIGLWKMGVETVNLARAALIAEGEQFRAAVCVVAAFAHRHGVDASPLLAAWDEALALRVEAAIQVESTDQSPPPLASTAAITEAEVNPPADYVTLDQMAASVKRSKRTLEKLKTRALNPLPQPDVAGGGGKPDEWLWHTVRPWLESEYGRNLPERFPASRPT